LEPGVGNCGKVGVGNFGNSESGVGNFGKLESEIWEVGVGYFASDSATLAETVTEQKDRTI